MGHKILLGYISLQFTVSFLVLLAFTSSYKLSSPRFSALSTSFSNNNPSTISSLNFHVNQHHNKPQSFQGISTIHSKNAQKSRIYSNPRNLEIGDIGNLNFPELTKHGLLTAADEIALAKQYKLSVHVKAQHKLMTEDLSREVMNDEVAEALGITTEHLLQLLEKGAHAKRILVQANMRLIFHIARFYRYRGVSYPDLVQEGTFGLMKAVDKYDPERGFRFSTYASWWIKQSVSRAIAEKSRIVRLPVHIHDLMLSVSRAEKQFSLIHMRRPTSLELAESLALPLPKVELLMKCARDVNSIDENIFQNRGKASDNNAAQVRDRLISSTAEPSFLNEKKSLRSELRRAMHHLSEREAQIIEMRFGLADGNEMTLEEIGRRFNVTRERIRQIESRALSKLRQPFRQSEFKDIYHESTSPAVDYDTPVDEHEFAF